MKKLLTTLLLFAVVLPAVGQKNKHSPTESYLQTKDASYTPKIPKNEFSCDFELILSSNLTYKRKISDKIAIGATVKLVGFAVGLQFSNENINGIGKFGLALDVISFGLLIDYKLNNRLYLEFSPHVIGFFDGGSDSFEITYSVFGLKNGIFFKFKHLDIGWNILIGNMREDTAGKSIGLSIYSSLLILRVPLKR